jgi:hypothetical protein
MDVALLISTGSSETLGTSTAQPNKNAKKVKHIDLAVMIRNGMKTALSSFLCSLTPILSMVIVAFQRLRKKSAVSGILCVPRLK